MIMRSTGTNRAFARCSPQTRSPNTIFFSRCFLSPFPTSLPVTVSNLGSQKGARKRYFEEIFRFLTALIPAHLTHIPVPCDVTATPPIATQSSIRQKFGQGRQGRSQIKGSYTGLCLHYLRVHYSS